MEIKKMYRQSESAAHHLHFHSKNGTLHDQPRTNNISEGWNNKFSSLVGEQHPSVWKYIETLQQECERVTTILLQNERGIRPTKRCKKVCTELQKHLCNLCEDRTYGDKTIAEFLRGIVRPVNDINNSKGINVIICFT